MTQYRVLKKTYLTQVAAEQVLPIVPVPSFTTQTVQIRVVQGGFIDDFGMWHQAPKRVKDAVRIGGIWYWARQIRDKHSGEILLSKTILFPVC